MTAAPRPDSAVWVCGHRETRGNGVWECVNPPDCDGTKHYYVHLVQTSGEGRL